MFFGIGSFFEDLMFLFSIKKLNLAYYSKTTSLYEFIKTCNLFKCRRVYRSTCSKSGKL